MIKKSDKIYIAGHRGMVGSACWRALESEGYINLIGKTSKELDLRDQKAIEVFIRTEKPVAIIDAAAIDRLLESPLIILTVLQFIVGE